MKKNRNIAREFSKHQASKKGYKNHKVNLSKGQMVDYLKAAEKKLNSGMFRQENLS